jgi:hypothetical protein
MSTRVDLELERVTAGVWQFDATATTGGQKQGFCYGHLVRLAARHFEPMADLGVPQLGGILSACELGPQDGTLLHLNHIEVARGYRHQRVATRLFGRVLEVLGPQANLVTSFVTSGPGERSAKLWHQAMGLCVSVDRTNIGMYTSRTPANRLLAARGLG